MGEDVEDWQKMTKKTTGAKRMSIQQSKLNLSEWSPTLKGQT